MAKAEAVTQEAEVDEQPAHHRGAQTVQLDIDALQRNSKLKSKPQESGQTHGKWENSKQQKSASENVQTSEAERRRQQKSSNSPEHSG